MPVEPVLSRRLCARFLLFTVLVPAPELDIAHLSRLGLDDLVVVGGRLKLYDDSNHGSLWPRGISLGVSLAALAGLASNSVFALFCR